MSAFPAYAGILQAGYTEKRDWGLLRTEMSGGIAKQRTRYSLPIVTRNCTILVKTTADRLAFDAWFKTDLAGGALWFDYTDPVDGATKQARITGPLAWAPDGGTWQTQVALESIG